MMQIRACQPDDLPTLKRIVVEAFDGVSIDQGIERHFGLIAGRDWRWRKAGHVEQDARRDAAGILVGVCAREVVGFVTTWQDRDTGIGHIPNLALRANARGRGYGRQLLTAALAHLRAQGCSHAKIETLEQNAIGQELYQSLGFREVARQIHFVADLNTPSIEGPTESK